MIKQARVAMIAIVLCAAPSLGRADTAPAAAAAVADDYRIGADDLLDIDVFEVNDLHRDVQVDANGDIKFPLIGLVPAAGRTTAQLSDDIRGRLEAKYLNHASVTVQVKTAQSQQVTVDGAVQSPGVYPISGRVTLVEALAMAKGLDPENANPHKVTVFRTVDSHWTRTAYDVDRIRHGQADDPVLQGRDVIVVGASHKNAVLKNIGNILPFILLAGAL